MNANLVKQIYSFTPTAKCNHDCSLWQETIYTPLMSFLFRKCMIFFFFTPHQGLCSNPAVEPPYGENDTVPAILPETTCWQVSLMWSSINCDWGCQSCCLSKLSPSHTPRSSSKRNLSPADWTNCRRVSNPQRSYFFSTVFFSLPEP